VSDNAHLANRLRSTLPDDFIDSLEARWQARDLSSEDDDHVIEMKMHFELLAVLEELERAEKVWQDGVDTISR
jgi:hypothetical protein